MTATIRALAGLALKLVVNKSTETSINTEVNAEIKTEGNTDPILTTITSDELEVPVPPGLWVQTKPHEKGEVLLARFALLSDKKEPGAAKYSVYYQKHGNPHFGNKKQLVTKATAEKIQARLNGLPVEEEGNGTKQDNDDAMEDIPDEAESEEEEKEKEDEDELAKRSGLRMKMRADEEEERVKSRTLNVSAPKKSIWERLDDKGSRKESVFDRLGKDSVFDRLGQDSVFDRLGQRSRAISRRRQNPYDQSNRSKGRLRSMHSSFSKNNPF